MLVHGNDATGTFAYKQSAVARISRALNDLIEARCNSLPPRGS
jgi:hypothetical protein